MAFYNTPHGSQSSNEPCWSQANVHPSVRPICSTGVQNNLFHYHLGRPTIPGMSQYRPNNLFYQYAAARAYAAARYHESQNALRHHNTPNINKTCNEVPQTRSSPKMGNMALPRKIVKKTQPRKRTTKNIQKRVSAAVEAQTPDIAHQAAQCVAPIEVDSDDDIIFVSSNPIASTNPPATSPVTEDMESSGQVETAIDPPVYRSLEEIEAVLYTTLADCLANWEKEHPPVVYDEYSHLPSWEEHVKNMEEEHLNKQPDEDFD